MSLNWSRRGVGVVAVTLCVLTGAPAANAGDISGAGYLMTVDDLRGDYGPIRDTTSTDLGRTLPSACDPPTGSSNTRGRESMSTPFSEVTFTDGLSIQNSVYLYRSPADARASFDLLRSRTLQRCQGQAFSQFGDDEEIVPQDAPGGYTDFFTYGVFTLVGSAIVQMQSYSDTPISGATRADLRHVNRLVVTRFT